MIKNFNFDFPSQNLPIENLRDFANVLKQNIKLKVFPFRLYYKYRAYKYARYVTPELNIIDRISNKNKVSLDVGANLGLFTYFLSRSSKKVFAFEPNPYPLNYLKNVVDKNVEIVPIALGSEDGDAKLKIPKNRKGWSSNGASIKNIKLNSGIEYDVKIRKIDSLDIKDIELIKIDVEGTEIDVLKGAINTIEKQMPNFIIENEIIHNNDPEELFHFMFTHGYKGYFLNKQKQLEELKENFNVFENQKNPENKKPGYIQNFIFVNKSRSI